MAHAGVNARNSEEFAASLESFAQGMSEPELRILAAVLESAIGPWERAARSADGELLSPDERELLDELTREGESG